MTVVIEYLTDKTNTIARRPSKMSKSLTGPINAVINYFLVCEAILEWSGNEQPSDLRASLLLTSEKAVFCNYK